MHKLEIFFKPPQLLWPNGHFFPTPGNQHGLLINIDSVLGSYCGAKSRGIGTEPGVNQLAGHS
ncbi:MAG: hypothetical protein WB992_00755 [Bryobacteraceae bacterium]